MFCQELLGWKAFAVLLMPHQHLHQCLGMRSNLAKFSHPVRKNRTELF